MPVVPGFRSLWGLGNSEPSRCLPDDGAVYIVAPTCPDGRLMPRCGSGFCDDAAAPVLPASVLDLLNRLGVSTNGTAAAAAPGLSPGMVIALGVAGCVLLGLVFTSKGRR